MCTKGIQEKPSGQVWWSLLVISTLRRLRQKDYFKFEEPGLYSKFQASQKHIGRRCLKARKNVIWWLKHTLWIVQLFLKGTKFLSKLFTLIFLHFIWLPLPSKRLRVNLSLKTFAKIHGKRWKCFKVHRWLSELLKWDQDNKTSQQYASLHCMTEYTPHWNLKIPDL